MCTADRVACAVSAEIQLIPEGAVLEALKTDYAAMLEDGLLFFHQPSFDEVITACKQLQNRINR